MPVEPSIDHGAVPPHPQSLPALPGLAGAAPPFIALAALPWLAAGQEPSAARLAAIQVRAACRIVRQMICEMLYLIGDRVLRRADRRRHACHVRQISMYVCHVALQIPQHEIGQALGRDRTTVGHACHVVEDRRDDPDFDAFVSAVERMARTVFGLAELGFHD